MGFGDSGLGFGVWGSGFRVWGLGFKKGLGCQALGLGAEDLEPVLLWLGD